MSGFLSLWLSYRQWREDAGRDVTLKVRYSPEMIALPIINVEMSLTYSHALLGRWSGSEILLVLEWPMAAFLVHVHVGLGHDPVDDGLG